MADLSEINWLPPRWIRYAKHLPVKGKPWTEVVESTAGRHRPSRYGPHPAINEGVVEVEEILAVAGPEPGQPLPEGIARGELRSPQANLRDYRIRLPYVIGASEGEETKYAFVMRATGGEVHGYPMRRERLIERGLPDDA